MLVDFDSLDDAARIWIYQSNREFSSNELKIIEEKTANFIANWVRHGDDLRASFTTKYNYFIVLAVDENFNNVSGCSIDASVNLIKQFEKDFGVDLTNKLNVSFKDQENINIVSLANFQKYAKASKINGKTIVFNNLVTTKKEFKQHWEVEAAQSWHQKFLSNN